MNTYNKLVSEQLVDSVDLGADISADDRQTLIYTAAEIVNGCLAVIACEGLENFALFLFYIFKAVYLLGRKRGRAEGGLTLVVAPETEKKGGL